MGAISNRKGSWARRSCIKPNLSWERGGNGKVDKKVGRCLCGEGKYGDFLSIRDFLTLTLTAWTLEGIVLYSASGKNGSGPISSGTSVRLESDDSSSTFNP